MQAVVDTKYAQGCFSIREESWLRWAPVPLSCFDGLSPILNLRAGVGWLRWSSVPLLVAWQLFTPNQPSPPPTTYICPDSFPHAHFFSHASYACVSSDSRYIWFQSNQSKPTSTTYIHLLWFLFPKLYIYVDQHKYLLRQIFIEDTQIFFGLKRIFSGSAWGSTAGPLTALHWLTQPFFPTQIPAIAASLNMTEKAANLTPDLAPYPDFRLSRPIVFSGPGQKQLRPPPCPRISDLYGRLRPVDFYIRPRPRPAVFMTYAPKYVTIFHTSKYALNRVLLKICEE